MKKFNLKNSNKIKKASLTAITTLAAGLVFAFSAAPIVASAEQSAVEPESVKIDVSIKETQDVYSVSLVESENGYTAVCDADESFAYETVVGEDMTTVSFGGLYVDGAWTYEMNYTFFESAEGEENENVLTVTKGADVVEVKISLGESIIYYDAYLEGEDKANLSAVLSEDGTSITVAPQENKAVAASDVMTVKIIIPDNLLIEDFKNTIELAEGVLFPKIYLTVAIIVLIALVILGFAMLFVAG